MARPDPVLEDDDRLLDDDDEPAGLAPRPRRRLPAPLALLAVLIAAVGFIAGVQVQKRQGGGATATGGLSAAIAARARLGQGSAPGAPGAARSGVTTGEVSSVRGRVLYVTTRDGTTIEVRVPHSATVDRTAETGAGSVHPGDTVVVEGAAGRAGTVTAASVSATASGISSISPFGAGSSGRASTAPNDAVGSLFGG